MEREAWDLIDEFYKLVEFDLDNNKQKESAKKCSIITVNKIIESNPKNMKHWVGVLEVLNGL